MKKRSVSLQGKRVISRTIFIVPLLLFALYLLFRILLTTPESADLVARVLSQNTGHTVTVERMDMVGRSLYLRGVSIESPPGFKNGKMISVRSMALTPHLSGIIRGKLSLSRLQIDGLEITMERNSKGVWNFSSLVQRFTKKKDKPSAEIFIGHFSVKDASLRINDRKIRGLGLKLTDFSTKGTTESKLELSAKDREGNPFRVTAAGRLGRIPHFHLTGDAPVMSFARLQDFLEVTSPVNLKNARGKLTLYAELRDKLFTLRTTSTFKGIALSYNGKAPSIGGKLDFSARYDFRDDRIDLSRADLALDNLITVRASGSMKHVGKESLFTLRVTPERFTLAAIASLLPTKLQRKLVLSGEARSQGFSLEGNRKKGITAVQGKISLESVALTWNKQRILNGIMAECSPRKTPEGWRLEGKVSTTRRKGSLPEALDAPFSIHLTSRFRPVETVLPTVKATISGVPVKAAFRYILSPARLFNLTCSATNVRVSSLNKLLWDQEMFRLSSGRLNAALEISGADLEEFKGKATFKLNSAVGTSGKNKMSLAKAEARSEFRRTEGRFSGTGTLLAEEGTLNGTPFDFSSGFTATDRLFTLRNAGLIMKNARFRAELLTLNLPKSTHGKEGKRIPIRARLSGGEARAGNVLVSKLSARLDSRYAPKDGEPRMYGNAHISRGNLSYEKQSLAVCSALIIFDGKTARADIKGTSLGGALSGRVQGGIFSKREPLSFSARLSKQQIRRLAVFIPRKRAIPQPSGGIVDISLKGAYYQSRGIDGTIEANGQDISLKNASGKTMVSGIIFTASAGLQEKNLTLREGVIGHARVPSLKIQGAMERFTSPQRKGRFSFSMPATPVNSLLDIFVNVLPRNLQEALCKGTYDLSGVLDVNGEKTRVNGTVALKAVELEVPSQKVVVGKIEGVLPLSLEFPQKEAEPGHSGPDYSKDNYPELLKELSRAKISGNRVTVDSLRFGALETEKLVLNIISHEGAMRFSPFEASFYNGKLFGNGYLILGTAPKYGANILINKISLKEFCEAFPSIRGYITGKVDGIVSLQNRTGKTDALKGFADLWTYEGNGEKMLVSKDFLQKLAGKKLRGFFFQNDRPYDTGEINAYLQDTYLTFEKLDISHTNFLGMKDLNVSVVPVQNRISLDHLLESIREAASRGKGKDQGASPVEMDLKWLK